MKYLVFSVLLMISCSKETSKGNLVTPEVVTGSCSYNGSILSPPDTVGPSSWGRLCISGDGYLVGTTVVKFDAIDCASKKGTFLTEGCPTNAVAKCESNADSLYTVIFLYESKVLDLGKQMEAFEKACLNSKDKFSKLR